MDSNVKLSSVCGPESEERPACSPQKNMYCEGPSSEALLGGHQN